MDSFEKKQISENTNMSYNKCCLQVISKECNGKICTDEYVFCLARVILGSFRLSEMD